MVALNTYLPDEAATIALGAALARALDPGLVIYLQGDLGAGKTTLVRAALRELGFRGPVKSPTYTLVELYELPRLHLHHFDFYRFHDPREWIDAGFRETFDGRNVILVEWPEKAGDLLPPPDVVIALEAHGEGRSASLRSCSVRGQKCVTLVARAFPYPSSTS